jgi:integrase
LSLIKDNSLIFKTFDLSQEQLSWLVLAFHCHTYLKSICAEAVEQDFLTKDPARKLKRPKTRKPDETVLEWGEYQSVIAAAETLRDKLVIKVGSGTAVRPGELFAFRWGSFEDLPNNRSALRVTETVYKGKIRAWAKTEASEAYVPLPKRLALELAAWRRVTAWREKRDFIFPNSKGGVLDYENFEARVVDPIRQKLGLRKLNFQILSAHVCDEGLWRAHGHTERCAEAIAAHPTEYHPGELPEAHS